MSGIMMFMISGACGRAGNGMPYGSIDVVTSRNLIASRRSFIHEVLKPLRLPGLEPDHASFNDHSGLVHMQISALAAAVSTVPPSTYSDFRMWMFEPPNTTARLPSGPVGIRP